MKIRSLCLFLMVLSIPVLGQNFDESEIDIGVLDESSSEMEEVSTLIIDNTKTKLGRDFYEEFYRQWSGMQLDSVSVKQFKEISENNVDLVIELEEIPSPGITNLVSIKIGELLVWQQFVQTRLEALELQSGEAVKEVFQYFISYQEIQKQLGTDDQMGTGIF
jgi:hypothetical protein